MRFLKRRPDTAYLDTWLWIPKRLLSVSSQKASLEFALPRGNSIQMWRDSPHHLGVPRGMIPLNEVRCEVVDLTPQFVDAGIRSKVTLDGLDPSKSTQRDAFQDLSKSRGGILNLACGAGKTVIMLHAAAHFSKPTLIISHQEEILEQWRGEIDSTLSVDGEVGWVQGRPDKWNWRSPICLAMIRSLAKYRDEVPDQMKTHFGTIIWDEAHHLSAPEFCKTADLFPGNRYGATATIERGDGSEIIYLRHIGGVIHENLDQDLMPRIVWLRSPIRVNRSVPEVRHAISDSSGNTHLKKLLIHVGCEEEELHFVGQHIQEAAGAGRKILALSSSVRQLELLHEAFPSSGLITGNVKGSDARRSALRDHKLCFGTVDLAKEALNDRALDCLFLLTEFVKDGMLQQAIGRIQRIMDGKKNPTVVVIRHHRVRQLEKMANKMETYFSKQGFPMEVAA